MGQKELLRGKVMELVRRGQMAIRTAAQELKVSYRQGRRAAYKAGGDQGLVHGNTGKASNRKTAGDVRETVLRTYQARYGDFGPAFAAEKLEEDEGIRISGETLRRWLVEEGLREGSRRRTYRSRRGPWPHFGEPVQFDGSPHAWFENRGPRCCLITMTDDAAKTRLSPFFEEETTAGAMTVLSYWIKKYGIPQSLYCDHKNAFVLAREPSDAELLKGITKPKSHFGRVCGKPDVEVIAANSPGPRGGWSAATGWSRTGWLKSCGLPVYPRLSRQTGFWRRCIFRR
jgi:transposase